LEKSPFRPTAIQEKNIKRNEKRVAFAESNNIQKNATKKGWPGVLKDSVPTYFTTEANTNPVGSAGA
jgi:hypothetical protein